MLEQNGLKGWQRNEMKIYEQFEECKQNKIMAKILKDLAEK